MKKWLAILLLFGVKTSYSQTGFYLKAIDSLVAINDKSSLNYCADSIYQPANNSLFLNATNVELFFADYKGKRLVKVNELTKNASDTSHIVYYFYDKQVVKIEAHMGKRHFSVDQVFYINKNKIVYPASLDKSPFNHLNLMERAKLYLKFNSKNYQQRLHSCDS